VDDQYEEEEEDYNENDEELDQDEAEDEVTQDIGQAPNKGDPSNSNAAFLQSNNGQQPNNSYANMQVILCLLCVERLPPHRNEP